MDILPKLPQGSPTPGATPLNQRFYRQQQWVSVVIVAFAAIAATFFRFFTLADRMTHCDDSGFLIQGLFASDAVNAGHRVASYWTYGPGQFVLGYPLWSIAGNWRNALYALRLPSAIAGTIAAFLTVWLLSKLSADRNLSPFAGMFSAVLGLCSLRAMVESQQGYPYSAACLSVTLTAVLLYWMTRSSPNLDPRRLPLLIGILAVWGSIAVAFSYQMTISIAASMLAILTVAYPDLRKPHAFQQISSRSWIAGSTLSLAGAAAFGWIFIHYLSDRLLNNQGVPPWAAFDVIHWTGSPLQYLQTIVMKWVYFAGFSTTPIWPERIGLSITRWIGFLLMVLVLLGLKSLNRSNPLWQRIIGWYCLWMLIASFFLSLFGKMPFGVTRHSHFLLPALLLLSGFGEANLLTTMKGHLKTSTFANWSLAAASAIIVTVSFFSFPTFHMATRNQFDLDRLVRLANDKKPLRILGSDCTFDAAAAQLVSHNQLFACPTTGGFLEGEIEGAMAMLANKKAPASIFIVDHRDDPEWQLRPSLKKYPTLRSILLVGIKPIGSTEMIGNINGGNGFFIRQVTKFEPGADTLECKASFLTGWHARETSASGWWRWSEGSPTLRVFTNQDLILQWQGTLLSMIWPQKLNILVNGKQVSTWDAKPTLDFSVPLQAGENVIQLVGQKPGIRSGTDTRFLSFGLLDLVLHTAKKATEVCELE